MIPLATAAPTVFQYQYWLYPFFVFMVFGGVYVMLGAMGKTSARGATFLFLVGFTEGAVSCVQLGLLPIELPMATVTLLALYAWRVH